MDKLYLGDDPESENLRSDSLRSNSCKGTLCEIHGYQEDHWQYQKVANRQPRSILIWEMSVTCHQSHRTTSNYEVTRLWNFWLITKCLILTTTLIHYYQLLPSTNYHYQVPTATTTNYQIPATDTTKYHYYLLPLLPPPTITTISYHYQLPLLPTTNYQ